MNKSGLPRFKKLRNMLMVVYLLFKSFFSHFIATLILTAGVPKTLIRNYHWLSVWTFVKAV
jgi:hypothetical protein